MGRNGKARRKFNLAKKSVNRKKRCKRNGIYTGTILIFLGIMIAMQHWSNNSSKRVIINTMQGNRRE